MPDIETAFECTILFSFTFEIARPGAAVLTRGVTRHLSHQTRHETEFTRTR